MGRDKATLEIDGIPLARRVASVVSRVCQSVTVLGREPLEGCRFRPDAGDYEGPLAALAAFEPEQPLVFVASCDLPLLEEDLIRHLLDSIGGGDAAVPWLDGRAQALCALYRAHCFDDARKLHAEGEHRVMRWLDRLRIHRYVGSLVDCARNVNTPEELEATLRRRRRPA